MIGRLSGRLLDCKPDRVLLDVTGVGYDLRIPLSTFYRLAGLGSAGTVSLHVHTHVRDDALQLFGFSTLEERSAFEQLIAISGIGPRIALAVLSGIGADELRQTVLAGDRDRLQRIPGVGRKTAERMLLELRDRLGLEAPAPSVRGTDRAQLAVREEGLESDAVSALVNLGYDHRRAESAVVRAVASAGTEATLEHVLRAALRGLVP
jgi:Holliday junction DNA helicase RuvA